ncbi:MAG TPA: Gmad2 immunoglobulin-like domain-containing protein [Candidatus Paceibacterota bacterium]|nr:Gmad2 immunoglobulin-like domain-containing protein [Candidatus Paceibacterota bacterium]
MNSSRITAIVTFIILIVLVVWLALYIMADKKTVRVAQPVPEEVTPVESEPEAPVPVVTTPKPVLPTSGIVTVHIGEMATLGNVSITPSEVVEDSRCPLGVMCIQAGRVRIDAAVHVGSERTKQTFLVGEPFIFLGKMITLTSVGPVRKKEGSLSLKDYTLTFKIEDVLVDYVNATADMVRVSSPPLGAVVGKQFDVRGEARGMWFFEASFPVAVLDVNGKIIAQSIAKAQGDWMTTDFVPFVASVTVPGNYIGTATVVLKKDNPSGMNDKDASMSFPINIEY